MVKKRGVLSRRFIAPIRIYASILCFFYIQPETTQNVDSHKSGFVGTKCVDIDIPIKK